MRENGLLSLIAKKERRINPQIEDLSHK